MQAKLVRSSLKPKIKMKGLGVVVAEMVECLCKALGSIPSTEKKKSKSLVRVEGISQIHFLL
jgi:hypothetical protein